MGDKGDKSSEDTTRAAELFLHKLTETEGITSKKMFGGYGIFHEGKMFGIIDSKGKAFFKVDESSKANYEAKGGHQHSRMPYYSLPEEVIADGEMLNEWATVAIKCSK